MEKVAIALKAKRSQSIFPRLPKVLLMWGVGRKSGVKIRFGSFCVRKATAEDQFYRYLSRSDRQTFRPTEFLFFC